jgi:integrase
MLERAGFAPTEVGGKLRRHMTFHGFRHTFASHWVMNGGELFKLQQIGGWKSHAMVQRYAHLAPHAFEGDWSLRSGVSCRTKM